MDKNVRISKSLINTRMKANVLNYFILAISMVALYFLILYLIFGFGFGYLQQKKDIKALDDQYELNLGKEASYEDYERVIKNFYFSSFADEICSDYQQLYNKNYTINHIYNVVVLKLPAEPSYDNFKTDYYQYSQKEDGSFDVDSVAVKVEGGGKYYEKNMHDLFYSSYNKLSQLLEKYNQQYQNLKVKNFNYELVARGISFLIVFLVMYVLYPIFSKEGSTWIERRLDIAYVNKKNGYLCKKWKIILKNVLAFCIPLVGILFANKYTIIILTIGYLFLDHLILLFSRSNLMLEEMLFRIEVCSISESLLFKNEMEEKDYLSSEEGKKIEDPDFMNVLEQAGSIRLPNNHENE